MKNKVVIILILCCLLTLTTAYAKSGDSNTVITGTYHFAASESNATQRENTFEYRDDCFTRSSFLGCKHLEILSIQAAASSISCYTDNVYEVGNEAGPNNLVELLENLEFEDVSTNTYYVTEKRENSVGVAVGHKTIIQDGNEYTLLAIIPRSAGYKQEWAGNLELGDGDMHEGFKAARDEILRYVKYYIEENEIEGALKVWIAGYSRGAAISDMVAGFLAGGGIEYFGEDVSITPEDIYCYTIGTPKTIKDGLDKNFELSVSGNRDEAWYEDDTPGDAFEYTKGGTVIVGDEIYGGLRNLVSPRDSFPLLPPAEYGFTYYGNVINPNEDLSSEEEMLAELESISPYMYEAYTEDDEIKPFTLKTFDLATLSVVEIDDEMISSEFMQERLDGIIHYMPTNADLKDNNYQAALQAFTSIYGMTAPYIGEVISLSGNSGDTSGDGITKTDLIEAFVFTLLDYSSQVLIEEGTAENEEEAIPIVIAEILSYFNDEEIDVETFKIDDFLACIAKFIADNEDKPVGISAVNGLASIVPDDYAPMVLALFGQFVVKESEDEEITMEEALAAYIKACYYGPDPQSSYMLDSYEPVEDPAQIRSLLYILMSYYLSTDYPEINDLIYTDGYGQGLFKDFIGIIIQKFMTVKDENGEVIKKYESVGEYADDKLYSIIEKASNGLLDRGEELYGEDFRNDLEYQVNKLLDNITPTRRAITILLLYSENGFDVEDMFVSGATFVSNAMQIVIEHFDEIYLAKARVAERYEDHMPEEISPSGDEPIESGDEPIESGDEPIESGDEPVESGDEPIESGETNPSGEEPAIEPEPVKPSKPAAGGSSSSRTKNKKKTQEETKETTETVVDEWANADDWALPELKEASSKKLIPSSIGKKDYTKPITRLDFAAIAVNLYETIKGNKVEQLISNPFKDINDETVIKAYMLGITNGTSEDEFSPDMPITREQMATMLARTLKALGINVTIDLNQVGKFADDKDIQDWAKESVYYMAQTGIVLGVGENTFNAIGNAKIEEAILIALRIFNTEKK